MQPCWLTKTMKDEKPNGLVHISDGNKTLCGKKFRSPLWFIGLEKEAEITCKNCLRGQKKIN